jgi:hypothetical protein
MIRASLAMERSEVIKVGESRPDNDRKGREVIDAGNSLKKPVSRRSALGRRVSGRGEILVHACFSEIWPQKNIRFFRWSKS